MNKMKRIIISLILAVSLVSTSVVTTVAFSSITVEAHSGRTDSNGGHRDNKNKSGLGSYHYHCGGNPPHLHKNGTCPYSTSKSTLTEKMMLIAKRQVQRRKPLKLFKML